MFSRASVPLSLSLVCCGASEMRIGGIGSPQLLSDRHWVVLDLAGDSLRIVEGEEGQIAVSISASHEGWSYSALPRVQSTGDSAVTSSSSREV